MQLFEKTFGPKPGSHIEIDNDPNKPKPGHIDTGIISSPTKPPHTA